MPIYDCFCGECGWRGERTSTIADRDSLPCPRCDTLVPLQRLIASPLFKFAGRVTPGGGPDRFTADMIGVPLKDLPSGLRVDG